MWKRQDFKLRPQKVRCPHCHQFVTPGNFCCRCAKKIRFICNCWVLNKRWRCGYDCCPGLRLYSELLIAAKNGNTELMESALKK
nr:MAG TPA: zinc-ribbon containing domain protein [Caudoviricetes sp.]